MDTEGRIRVGVLALQGAFREHVAALESVGGCVASEVRTPAQLDDCDALVMPGGESTAIEKLARENGLWEALETWVRDGRPTWGTCAGMILLSKAVASGEATGGQGRLGGLAIEVARNYFGKQVRSFQQELDVKELGKRPYTAVFIRAPAVVSWAPEVSVLATVSATRKRKRTDDTGAGAPVKCGDGGAAEGVDVAVAGSVSGYVQRPGAVAVAVRHGNLMGTAFHPELTSDHRWHAEFLRMARAAAATAPSPTRT